MITLQNFILRDHSLAALPVNLYERSDNDGSWVFENDGCVQFNTYFNLLNAAKIKSVCTLPSLSLKLNARGDLKFIIWGSNDLETDQKVLESFEVNTPEAKEIMYPLSFWNKCTSKFIYLEVHARASSEINSLAYVTDSAVEHSVKLGTVIVHFNRKEWVLPALKRLRDGLLNDEDYKNKISLTVIDNSQNITSEEAAGINVIPNPNLGGSGGFTRGLLSYKDRAFTHCLFMDDDASCEVESIKRTWAILSYAKKPNTAIAGSLFHEENPSIIYEKGAYFSNQNNAVCGGFDMVSVNDLATVEASTELANYGGWWFFAFPIGGLSHFPFPFFVRGDDVMFSLQNKFEIMTINGIGCWGSDFASKSSPLSCYLDMRSLMLNNIISNKNSMINATKVIGKFFFLHLLSFNYASAKAILLSIKHISSDHSYWLDNMDMNSIRREISSFSELEKMKSLDLKEYSYDIGPVISHRGEKGIKIGIGFKMYLQLLLFNGAFLPEVVQKKRALLIQKGFYGTLKYAFRYRRLIYYHEKSRTGYVASLERKTMFILLFSFIWQAMKLIILSPFYRAQFKKAVDMYSQETFWREVYK